MPDEDNKVKTEKYFFYKGTPYKKDFYRNTLDTISGNSVWDNEWSNVIKMSEVEFCEEDEIEKVYIEKCKEGIRLSMFGWTSEKAKEVEEKGREYLNKKFKYHILKCPDDVYKACLDGKYGVLYRLSGIVLPEELWMENKPCSDGITRNEKDYMRYILGEDWSMIRLFMLKWPMLKFSYVDLSKADDPFPDIYCMVPFHDDHTIINDIYNSVLL